MLASISNIGIFSIVETFAYLYERNHFGKCIGQSNNCKLNFKFQFRGLFAITLNYLEFFIFFNLISYVRCTTPFQDYNGKCKIIMRNCMLIIILRKPKFVLRNVKQVKKG